MHRQLYLLLLTHTSIAACPNQDCTATDHLGFVSAIALGADQPVEAFLTIKTIQTERPLLMPTLPL